MTDSSTGSSGPRWTSERLDALFSALTDEVRRQILRYFQVADDDIASVDDLVDALLYRGCVIDDRERLETTLLHVALPELAETRFVEYDARSRTIRYSASPLLEQVLTVVFESDAITE